MVSAASFAIQPYPAWSERRRLPEHALIGFDDETSFLRSAKKLVPIWELDAFALRADSDIAKMAQFRSGAGIDFCQVPMATRDPALIRVLPQQVGFHWRRGS